MRDLSKLILDLDSAYAEEIVESLTEDERTVLDIIAEILSRGERIMERDIEALAGSEVDVEKAVEALTMAGLIKFNR